jgi:hypothetical protein
MRTLATRVLSCSLQGAAPTLSRAVCGRRNESKPSGDGGREDLRIPCVPGDTLGIVGPGNLRGSASAHLLATGRSQTDGRWRRGARHNNVKTRVCLPPTPGGQPKLKKWRRGVCRQLSTTSHSGYWLDARRYLCDTHTLNAYSFSQNLFHCIITVRIWFDNSFVVTVVVEQIYKRPTHIMGASTEHMFSKF